MGASSLAGPVGVGRGLTVLLPRSSAAPQRIVMPITALAKQGRGQEHQ
jgi:hypothetical protein